MNAEAALDRFDRLAVWSRRDQRDMHKPLLVLYAMARWCRGDRAAVAYSEVDRDLTEPFREFGPSWPAVA